MPPPHLPTLPASPVAQLFVLFGLPALVLVLSYAFNDPQALMISLPLMLLIPGIRWAGLTAGRGMPLLVALGALLLPLQGSCRLRAGKAGHGQVRAGGMLS